MDRAKIVVRDVEKTFTNGRRGKVTALKGVNLAVREGELLCLLGPSGSGKSTLLDLMAGFDQPSSGQVLIDGRSVVKPNPKFVTIFQDYGLFPWRTVLGNVEYGLEARGLTTRERRETAGDYIRLVGLMDFSNRHPHELSGGMKQRVALARALAVEPDILFMDEPFGALDVFTRMKMEEELINLWQKNRCTIVFVTHDIEEATYLADRVAILSADPGRIETIITIELGRPRDRTGYEFDGVRNDVFEELGLKVGQREEYNI